MDNEYGNDYEELIEVEEPEEEKEDEEPTITSGDIIKDISEHMGFVLMYYELYGMMPPTYSQYAINNAFFNFRDTVYFANQMNFYPNIPDYAHFKYMFYTVPPAKRFAQWPKQKDMTDIELLAKYFQCSAKEMQKNVYAIPKDTLEKLLNSLKNDQRRD